MPFFEDQYCLDSLLLKLGLQRYQLIIQALMRLLQAKEVLVQPICRYHPTKELRIVEMLNPLNYRKRAILMAVWYMLTLIILFRANSKGL